MPKVMIHSKTHGEGAGESRRVSTEKKRDNCNIFNHKDKLQKEKRKRRDEMIPLTMICNHRFLSVLLEFDEDTTNINGCLKNNGH